MSLLIPSAICANEWQYFGGTEAVTLYRKTGDSTFDSGTPVANAFSPGAAKEIGAGGKLLSVNRNQFILWASQTGTPPPKIGDVIQELGSFRWTIWRVEIQAFGARFVCQVKQER